MIIGAGAKIYGWIGQEKLATRREQRLYPCYLTIGTLLAKGERSAAGVNDRRIRVPPTTGMLVVAHAVGSNRPATTKYLIMTLTVRGANATRAGIQLPVLPPDARAVSFPAPLPFPSARARNLNVGA